MGVVSRIDREVRFAAPDGWTVRVISLRAPGDTRFRQYYAVRQWSVLVCETTHVHMVKRAMGAAFVDLVEVTP